MQKYIKKSIVLLRYIGRSEMKSKFKDTPTVRTSGRFNQPKFDRVIAELDISSLRFLKQKYNEDIKEFSRHYDLNNSEYHHEYKLILQRKNMIDEEYEFRLGTANIEFKKEEHFDTENGIVYDESGKELYAIAYSEEEDDMVYTNLNATCSSECRTDDETDYELYEPIDRKAKYAKWDYTKMVKNE